MDKFYNTTMENQYLLNSELERNQKFEKLRLEAIDKARQDLEHRLKINPIPTAEELNMGLFKERLEPQVREAVLGLYRKGYKTFMSGFNGRNPKEQFINFYEGVTVPQGVKEKLEYIDVKVTKIKLNLKGRGEIEEIEFTIDEPNLDVMKSKWDKIEKLMPDLGGVLPTISSSAAIEFRKKFS